MSSPVATSEKDPDPSADRDRRVHSATKRRLLRCAVLAGVLAWAFATGAGLQFIWQYKSTPGSTDQAPRTWPGSTLVAPQPGKPTLMMFVHPHCSCSRASLAELKGIMDRARGRVSAWVLFLRPQGTSQEWERTPSWTAAKEIPGVQVLMDEDGTEAARFGASTSGHLVLYDADGRLLFGGGITGARGHVGANSGSRSVMNYLNGAEGERHDHPVFGCGFHDLDRQAT